MAVMESNEGPVAGTEPEQAESSTRKRRRTSFTLTVWHALFINWMMRADRTTVPQVNKELIQHMVKFMSAHASFFVAGSTKRSRIMMQQEAVEIQKEVIAPPPPPTKMLKFVGPLKEPIYTNRNLSHKDNQPLEVQLTDIKTSEICTDSVASRLQVEIVVLDGDFCPDGQQDWTSDQFEHSIMGPRKQKGPLLVSTVEKKVVRRLANGKAVFSDLVITDNSTLAKNKKFRLGARVTNYQGPRIIEAWSEDFRVRDCRGEDDEKHDPPSLDDKVWRLKHIRRNGVYSQRMSSFENHEKVKIPIKTVRDFVTMQKTDQEHLKNTLKISEKKWKEIVEQAERALVPREISTVGNETQPNPVPQVLAPTTHQDDVVGEMFNSEGNEPEPNLVSQVLAPAIYPNENMGVSHLQQLDSHTELRFDQTESFPTNSTINQGHATNYFLVLGETDMFISEECETEANQLPHPIEEAALENMAISQQVDPSANLGFGQLEAPPIASIFNGGNAQQVDPQTNLGLDQISGSLLITTSTFNGDKATLQEREEPSYVQTNNNQYIRVEQLSNEDGTDGFLSVAVSGREMVQSEPNEGPEPEQAEPSTRKRKRTSFTQTVWHVLFINWVSQADGTVMLQVNEESTQHMVEFMFAYAGFFTAGGPKRSRTMIQKEAVAPPPPPTKMLKFVGPLKEPIYTNRNLSHKDNQPLEVQLTDIKTSEICTDSVASRLQVEIVVLDGDFCPDDQQDWTSDQFEHSIMGPRKQKGPLLVSTVEKKVVRRLANGKAVFSDLVITDNSTLAKNKKFRLGARVTNYQGPRIIEAWSEDFRVRDCRGEERMKHDIPLLDDDVWRLVNIGKNGKYHNILVSAGIKTVQDFLNLLNINPQLLKDKSGMSQKKWQSTIEHAKKCLNRGGTTMFNSGGNEHDPNLVSQVGAPAIYHPHENTDVQHSPQLDSHVSHTDPGFDQMESFPLSRPSTKKVMQQNWMMNFVQL